MENAKSVVLVDARGLTVAQDTALRKRFREANVCYKVYKNSMMDFAFKDSEFGDLCEHLAGPSAVAFSYDDATTAAKIIEKAFKEMPKLEFKAGVIDGVMYDAKGMEVIAKIPSREELLSKLLGSFKSPMSSFARVIKAIADNGGEVAPAEEATPEVTAEPVAEAIEAPAQEVVAQETVETPEVTETSEETVE